MHILFATYGAGHVNMIIPVIREIQMQKKHSFTVLGLTTAGYILEKAGIPYIGFKDLVGANTRALEKGKELSKGFSNSVVPLEETYAYMGLSYLDLERKLGEEAAAAQYALLGRNAFNPTSVLQAYLEKSKPDLVFATNSPRAERASIEAAGMMGIPAICLIDLFGISEVKWIGQSGYANKICVLSEYVKNLLIASGRLQEEIIVTGNPVFDRLVDDSVVLKGEQLRATNNWGSKKVLLWASQAEPQNPALPRMIEDELFKVISRRPEWKLIVRLHPNENYRYSVLPNGVEVSDSAQDLSSLLSAVDLVITMASTVGLEAAILGKPVVSIQMSQYSKDAPYSDLNVAVDVFSFEELEKKIDYALSEFIPRTDITQTVGKATQNIIRVIEEFEH